MATVSPWGTEFHTTYSAEPSIDTLTPQPEHGMGIDGMVMSPEAPIVELKRLSHPDSQSRIASSVKESGKYVANDLSARTPAVGDPQAPQARMS